MTSFSADQLRTIINLSERRYNECRTDAGHDADITKRMLDLNKTAAAMLRDITTGKKFEYINTGRAAHLGDLLLSGDITDSSEINVFGPDGDLLTRGRWYEDNVLAYANVLGVARKVGSGLTVSFNLSAPVA